MRRNKQYPLPKNWDWVPFGECAQLVNGRAYSQDELLDQGTPVLRIQNLNGGDRWYYSNLNLPPEKYCESGDLLFAWSATFGPYRWIGQKSIYHYHIWKVLPKNNLDKAFAFRLLERISQEIKSAAHGVTMVHMTKSGMEEWKVPLPPIAEQKRIAAILDKAEELRGLRRKALEELDAIVQSIFLEMFGNPVMNPMGWQASPLHKVCDEINDCPHSTPAWTESGVVCLRTSNLTEGSWNWEDTRFVSVETYHERSKRGYVQAGDIILSREGTVGVAAIVTPEMKVCMGQRLVQLRGMVNLSR